MSLLGVLGIVTALAMGCGGGSSGSGVPATTKLTELTPDQAKAVCDYSNAKQGGYGRKMTCSDGLDYDTHSDQAFCITQLPGLGSVCNDLTVGDIEGCADATGADLCKAATAPGCAALEDCYNN
jgi:hypothetical protein